MLRQLPITFVLASVSAFAQQTITYTYSGAPLYIFTDDANTASVAGIPVLRSFDIQKVTITVDVAYAPVEDINLFAYSPDGTRTKLVERNCGNQGTLLNMSFDDSAQSKYSDFCPAEPGRGPFRGNEPLSNFRGKNSSGTWRLAVENNGSNRTGWLNGWSITFTTGANLTTPTVADIVNRSSLKGGAIAPGSNILVYGVNLGPSTPQYTPAGQALPTSLNGVQVMLNGSAIPLKGVSSYGIDAVVPNNVTVGSPANIHVVVNGSVTNTTSPAVYTTAPGLFSQGQVGSGPLSASWNLVRAVDVNYKMITDSNPAVKGNIVTVYASGLGPTSPSLPADQVPPGNPLYPTTTPTNASIGGVAAPVLFAGLAPGFPGVYQVNIQVPTTVQSGYQQILVWNGGGVSQDPLYIPVK
jgi:uncharacterized protein (TIGR03437 family)